MFVLSLLTFSSFLELCSHACVFLSLLSVCACILPIKLLDNLFVNHLLGIFLSLRKRIVRFRSLLLHKSFSATFSFDFFEKVRVENIFVLSFLQSSLLFWELIHSLFRSTFGRRWVSERILIKNDFPQNFFYRFLRLQSNIDELHVTFLFVFRIYSICE